ncbi:hypothetical protein KJ567_04210, partial [Candidatus Bipolaricaulota bacterium]|nr:hypothetical protein [Candidatus Bipolaricaulota bacterium]
LLANYGFEECRLVTDHDLAGQTDLVKGVLNKTRTIACRIFIWPQSLHSLDRNNPKTDPDQAVLEHGFDAVEDAFKDESNFKMPHKWALEKADVEMSSIAPDDVRRLTAMAAEWGLYVTNAAERHKYITDVAERYKIPPGPIATEVLSDDDSESAFIQRITDTLASRFIVMQTVPERQKWAYRCWHKAGKQVVDLPIGDARGLRSAIEAAEGKDLLAFVLEDVGEPGFEPVRFHEEEDQVYLQRLEKYLQYVVAAVSNLGRSLPPAGSVRALGAGFHLTGLGANGQMTVHLVNGASLYRGESSATGLQWTEIDGPRDGGVGLHATQNMSPRVIHPQIRSAKDLELHEGMLSLSELYKRVREIVSTGWDFKDHEVTVDLVTAYALLVPISDIVERQPMIIVTSEFSGGKTQLVGGLIGGRENPEINVLQNAEYMSGYTVAGVRQRMNRSKGISLSLDEFEDKGTNDKKSVHVRAMLDLLRGLAARGIEVVQGTADGTGVTYELRMPVMVAAIRGLCEPADLSRFAIVEMERKLERKSPSALLLAKFGLDGIRQVRETLPVVMYGSAEAVLKAYQEIKEEDAASAGDPGGVTRIKEMLFGLMAVMRASGRDDKAFFAAYGVASRRHVVRQKTASLGSDILADLMHTRAIQETSITNGYVNEKYSVHAMLLRGGVKEVNAAYCGVYYSKERKWLIVHWPAAIGAILRYSSKFAGRGSGWLKEQGDRSEKAIDEETLLRSGILQDEAVIDALGNVPLGEVTAFSLREDGECEDEDEADDDGPDEQLPVPKGREVTSLADDPRFKARIDAMTFPKPPALKKKSTRVRKG